MAYYYSSAARAAHPTALPDVDVEWLDESVDFYGEASPAGWYWTWTPGPGYMPYDTEDWRGPFDTEAEAVAAAQEAAAIEDGDEGAQKGGN